MGQVARSSDELVPARRHQKPPSYLKSIDWMKNGLRVVIFWASWPHILGPICPTCMKIGPSMYIKNLKLTFIVVQVAKRHQNAENWNTWTQ